MKSVHKFIVLFFVLCITFIVLAVRNKDRITNLLPETKYTPNVTIDSDENASEIISNFTNQEQVAYDIAKAIVSELITADMSDLEKEVKLHDYVVLNSRYYDGNGIIPEDCYSAYGLLTNGTGVCEAYARTMELLLDLAGIETIFITGMADNGDTNESHAWNLVKLDGDYYHLDATWDDPVPDREGIVSRAYLNLSDSQMAKNHVWDRSEYPLAESSKYNYYSYSNLIANSAAKFRELLNYEVLKAKERNEKSVNVYVVNYDSSYRDILFDFVEVREGRKEINYSEPKDGTEGEFIFIFE